MPDSFPRSKPGWGKKLVEALTEDQIETLLDVLVDAGTLSRLSELRALDSDLADTVERLVGEADPIAAEDSEAAVSKQKLLKNWNNLWERWDGHVCEVGDEKGKYTLQDADWEPPYFDPAALGNDLEKIAIEMKPMVSPVSELLDDPELFVDAVHEIDDNIHSFPEWMQGEERCDFGLETTTCLLDWTWRVMVRSGKTAEEFLERIFKLDDDASSVYLDSEAALDFFDGLPDDVCGKLYTVLGQERFAAKRNDLHSLWHLIHQQYQQRFDPAAYLRSCERLLGSDWRYGESLIAAAISGGDFGQAEFFVEQTFVSLLRAKEVWRPEDRLLLTGPYYSPGSGTSPASKLLKVWETIAEQQGNRPRAAACRLQRAAIVSAADWPAILNAFTEFESQGGTPATGEKLFAEWRKKVVEWCPQCDQRGARPADSWIYWLIEARRDPLTQGASFLDHLKIWLGRFTGSPAFIRDNRQALALLTRNLPSAEQIKGRYPTFYAHVLTMQYTLDPTLEKSLREALTFLTVDPVEIEPMPVWQEHLHLLVPSPGSGDSSYKIDALSMKALFEVNRASYDKLIAEWKVVHRRRRNLWAEMAALKLPVV
jgi:hypothetical protein